MLRHNLSGFGPVVSPGGRAAGSKMYGDSKRRNKLKTSERAVLVTTAHKGVFFGYAKETSGPTIKLRSARLCVYWTTDLRGFMGLASDGPSKGCRIGPAADIELRDITSIVEVSEKAIAKWESAPWS